MRFPMMGRIMRISAGSDCSAESAVDLGGLMFLLRVAFPLLAVALMCASVGCATTRTGVGLTSAVKPVAEYHVSVDAETLFEGCAHDAMESSTNLTCDEQVVTYAESTEKSADEFQRLQREAIAENLGDFKRQEDAVALSIEDKLLAVLQFSVFSAEPESTLAAYIYAVSFRAPEGPTRGAMCTATAGEPLEQERCLKMVGHLVLHGLPPENLEEAEDLEGLEELAEAPSFLGRPLDVPDGCEPGDLSESSGHINCNGGSLSWFVVEEGDKADLIAKAMAEKLRSAKGLKVEERDRVCQIDGNSAPCTQLFTTEEGEPKNAVIVRADIGEAHVVALCYNAGSTETLHLVCGDLMTVE